MNQTKKKSIFLPRMSETSIKKHKRTVDQKYIMHHMPCILFLQETKIQIVDKRFIREFAGRKYNEAIQIPTQNTTWDLMILWSANDFTKLVQIQERFTITVDLACNFDDTIVRLIGV
jgi:hypothetical protein